MKQSKYLSKLTIDNTINKDAAKVSEENAIKKIKKELKEKAKKELVPKEKKINKIIIPTTIIKK
jgi:multidrug efflux pump subunit AcrB